MIAARTRSLLAELWTGGGWILIVISIGWFLSLGSRLIYPVLLPQITAEFVIDYGTAGIVLSVLWIAYATMSIPGGVLGDRIGERLALMTATTVAMIGVFLIVTAPTFGVFLVATFVLGAGCGMFGTTGTTILSDVFTERDTTAIGLSQVAATVGTIILPVIAGLLAVSAGWRLGIGYVIPGFLAVTVGLWIVVPSRTSPTVGSAGGSRWMTLRRLGRTVADRTLVIIVVAMACVGFVYQGLTGFLPVYLIDIKGYEQRTASVLFGILFTGMIVGKLSSGPISARIGKRNALIGFAGISAPAILALPFVEHPLGIITVVWIAGLMLGFSPVAMAYVIRFIPDDIQGSVFGIVRTTFIGIGVLGPPIVGILADRGQFDTGILLLGAIAVVAVVFSLLLPSLED